MSPSQATRNESSSTRRARLEKLREAVLHRKVLARRLPSAFNGRWTRRHWAHASLFATLGALVAAIVPGFSNVLPSRAPTPRTTLAPALPATTTTTQTVAPSSLGIIPAGNYSTGTLSTITTPTTLLPPTIKAPITTRLVPVAGKGHGFANSLKKFGLLVFRR